MSRGESEIAVHVVNIIYDLETKRGLYYDLRLSKKGLGEFFGKVGSWIRF